MCFTQKGRNIVGSEQLIDFGELGVSYYEIGGTIQAAKVSDIESVVQVQDVPALAATDYNVPDSPIGVCYAPAEQPHLPYSYGHPLVNLGANVLIRALTPFKPDTSWYEEELPQ